MKLSASRTQSIHITGMATGYMEHTVHGHGHSGHRWQLDRDLDRAGAQADEDRNELLPA